jgi:CRISPR/Cas system CMR subunit Cmr6 (Cas7 group RAMP superfamily)
VLRAAGPFRELIYAVPGKDRATLNEGNEEFADANALVMVQRIAFFEANRDRLDEAGKRALLTWAHSTRLGQDAALVAAVSERREAALRALGGTGDARSVGPGRRLACLRLRAEPEWRLVVGLGNKANPHEIGLALHGTYGWPVIPGPGLKGLAAAWASSPESGADPGDVRRIFGGPRPGEKITPATPAGRGTVRFLDAIPDSRPVSVVADVMTPHVKPYYDRLAAGKDFVPPAEYHNPVPLTFLTVRGGFAVDLYGSSDQDVQLAADWLTAAGEELGAGAKTAAGYGYLAMERKP